MATTTYTMPFDPDNFEDLEVEELLELAENYGVEFIEATDEDYLRGDFDSLSALLQELDGPGQSWPVDEFFEFLQDWRD
jgi:hypothetical protein